MHAKGRLGAWTAWAAAALLALALPAYAALDVQMVEAQIETTEAFLHTAYAYPVFCAADGGANDTSRILTKLITEPMLARYDALYAEHVAHRTPVEGRWISEYEDAISSHITHFDQRAPLVQVVCSTAFWPAEGNGDFHTNISFCIDTQKGVALSFHDLFEEDETAVYAEVNALVQDLLSVPNEKRYPNASVTVGTADSFCLQFDEGAVCFLFDPYTLTSTTDTLSVPLRRMDLTLRPDYAALF